MSYKRSVYIKAKEILAERKAKAEKESVKKDLYDHLYDSVLGVCLLHVLSGHDRGGVDYGFICCIVTHSLKLLNSVRSSC